MKYVLALLSVSLFFSGCGGNGVDLINEPDSSTPQITYKEAFKAGTFENEKMSFGLYYESELGTVEISPSLIGVYEKGSSASKDLEVADISVLVNSGQLSETYDDVLNYNGSGVGVRSYVYDFSEADSVLDTKRHVDVVEYTGSPIVIYTMYWIDYGKDYYVQITQNTAGDNRLLQAEAIFKTIELKGITD